MDDEWNLLILMGAWFITLIFIHLVSPLLNIIFFLITFPLIIIITILLAKNMEERINNEMH
jgi:hypothetical protein